jgi:glycosyltransferase involved in cell wall biosynthesis
MISILFLTPYPLGESPSQRFRFEQYLEILKQNNFRYNVQSFLDAKNWKLFFQPGKPFTKALILLRGFLRRVNALFTAGRYDYIFIHREVSPVGPPLFEWILAKVLRKKIVYDFDDAIWLTDRVNEPFYLRFLKWRSKVGQICRWSYRVSCGNAYLAAYALQFNKHVVYNPTTIDTEHWHNPSHFSIKKDDAQVTIGWTGSHTTLKYLKNLEPELQSIVREFPWVSFLVIADREPNLVVPRLIFKPWTAETEIQDLMLTDIGIMPLPDDEWSKGKCGFKALQYMALKIPAVVSPVGVNDQIIDHGVNGFLAEDSEAWHEFLAKLINDVNLREKMGEQARQKVIAHYSVMSNATSFLSLFT